MSRAGIFVPRDVEALFQGKASESLAETLESLAEALDSQYEASECLVEASECLADASESLAEASESLVETSGTFQDASELHFEPLVWVEGILDLDEPEHLLVDRTVEDMIAYPEEEHPYRSNNHFDFQVKTG